MAGSPGTMGGQTALLGAASAMLAGLRAAARERALSAEEACTAAMLALSVLAQEADLPTRCWLATCASIFDAEEGRRG